jgi:hypothetical protein
MTRDRIQQALDSWPKKSPYKRTMLQQHQILGRWFDAHKDTIRTVLESALNDGWQDISTAPKDGTRFITNSAFGVRQVWFEDEINDFTFGQLSYGTGGYLCYVGINDVGGSFSKWRPFPAPPQEE